MTPRTKDDDHCGNTHLLLALKIIGLVAFIVAAGTIYAATSTSDLEVRVRSCEQALVEGRARREEMYKIVETTAKDAKDSNMRLTRIEALLTKP